MNAATVLAELAARDVLLWADGDRLGFDAPVGTLTDDDRAALRSHKAEIIRQLAPPPYLSDHGELIIPTNAPALYRYWASGQSLAATLAELNAPVEAWRRYLVYSDAILTDTHATQCSTLIQSCGAVRFCPDCRWFAEVTA